MHEADRMKDVLEEAGRLAMRYHRRVKPSLKENRTFVTEADLAVRAFLQAEIAARYPDDGIIAEEEGLRSPPASGSRHWIIDPIDGTASFVSGLPVWGIAVGLAEAGRPRAGLFLMPATGDFFRTTEDGRVLRNGETTRMRAPGPLQRETSLLTISRIHRRYTISPEYEGKARSLGSAIAHLAYLATGAADAVLLGRSHVWDLAAGWAMLAANGGELRYLDGEEVSLTDLLDGQKAPRPILAGHPEMVARFAEVIRFRSREAPV